MKDELEEKKLMFFESIGMAILYLKQINHWKGLAHAYKLVTEAAQECNLTQEQLTEYGSEIKYECPQKSPRKSRRRSKKAENVDNSEIFIDARKKHADYSGMYRRTVSSLVEASEMSQAICI